MKTVLCYGDSNTYGLKEDLVSRYDREVRWTGRLRKLLGNSFEIIEEGLSERTTIWEDTIHDYRSGKSYLIPCLESHKPIDLLVLSLGINDLKKRQGLSLFEAELAMETLIEVVLDSRAGIEGKAPEVLLVAPPVSGIVTNPDFEQMFPDLKNRSRELGQRYERVVAKYGVHFLNPGEQIETNSVDGIHYTEAGHARLAEMIAERIKEII